MNLFVDEYLCAGGMGDQPPHSLLAEGWAMLSALAADFARIPGVHVTTRLVAGLPEIPNVHCVRAQPSELISSFRSLVNQSDATIVIAPEFDDILAHYADLVLAQGHTFLGCRTEAIRQTADKLALAQFWTDRDVPTPPTKLLPREIPVAPVHYPVVVKPRHGAGSQATRLIHDSSQWRQAWPSLLTEIGSDEFLVQPYCPGKPCSIAFLIGEDAAISLVPTEQLLSADGEFHYQGGRLPLLVEESQRAIILGRRAIQGITGLAGYVGVDLILGPDNNGQHDVAIEINPRLTTSYIGLRQLCTTNLAATWLQLHLGRPVTPLSWHAGPVTFAADGRFS